MESGTGTCPGCGRSVEADASFCGGCGRPVAATTPPPSVQQPQAAPAAQAPWLARSAAPSTAEQPAPWYDAAPAPTTVRPAAWLDDGKPWADGGEQDSGTPLRRWGAVLLALAVVLVVAGAVTAWLVFPSSDSTAGPSAGQSSGSPTGPTMGTGSSTGPASPTASASAADYRGSLTSAATASAPVTSPNGVDAAGNPTSYAAAQMLDGDPATCWRLDGDGSGTVLTFRLDGPYAVTTVGLVNGYAKIDPSTAVDRYAQGRRITRVTWLIGDRSVSQELVDGERSPQTISFPAVTTSVVQLRIDGVTGPGDAAFDRTSISDVTLVAG